MSATPRHPPHRRTQHVHDVVDDVLYAIGHSPSDFVIIKLDWGPQDIFEVAREMVRESETEQRGYGTGETENGGAMPADGISSTDTDTDDTSNFVRDRFDARRVEWAVGLLKRLLRSRFISYKGLYRGERTVVASVGRADGMGQTYIHAGGYDIAWIAEVAEIFAWIGAVFYRGHPVKPFVRRVVRARPWTEVTVSFLVDDEEHRGYFE